MNSTYAPFTLEAITAPMGGWGRLEKEYQDFDSALKAAIELSKTHREVRVLDKYDTVTEVVRV